jgi:C4-dicarboxylate-specific signal transduction histidine kinase
MLATVTGELTRSATVTRNLLSYVRSLPRPALEPFDLSEAVRRTVEQVIAPFAEQQVRIQLEPPPGPIPLTGVRAHAVTVVRNLLDNARDAIVSNNRPGWIRIRLVAEDSAWLLEVSDSGGGVREPERAFEPFYTTREVGPGAGLGLVMAKGVMRDLGGRIQLGRGEEGAVFSVRFPRPDATAAILNSEPAVSGGK